MKTILATVDFSSASDPVIATALELARTNQARVVLLSVVQPPLITSEYAAAMMENYAEITAEVEKAADRRLQDLLKRFRAAEVPTRIVRLTGAPVTQILAQAREHRADFIVMGSHGHTAFYDLLVGSTTHGVLLRAPCPVVIVPSSARKTARAARSGRRR